MGIVLTILIAAAVLGYAVYLAVKMIRRPASCCGACSGCPMGGSCRQAKPEAAPKR